MIYFVSTDIQLQHYEHIIDWSEGACMWKTFVIWQTYVLILWKKLITIKLQHEFISTRSYTLEKWQHLENFMNMTSLRVSGKIYA